MLTDLHTHSTNSLCAHRSSTVQAMVEAASSAGLQGLGITDHLHPDTDPAIFRDNREQLSKLEAVDVKVWIGTEADVTTLAGDITGNPEIYRSLDYVMAGIHHYHLPWIEKPDVSKSPVDVMYFAHQNLLNTVRNPWVDAIGHPWVGVFGYLHGFQFRYEYIQMEWIEELGSAAKAYETALELPVWALIGKEEIPAEEYLNTIVRPLIRSGCLLFAGTDSHHPEGIGQNISTTRRLLLDNGAEERQIWTPDYAIEKRRGGERVV
ncbi:MAG: zinc-dependent hydrolase YcdX, partial [Cohnella sp.]|nr:zinc-dependent hydrolase YcdX [Cohnella sp.]